MNTKKTKDKRDKAGWTDSGCCPGGLKEMLEMMNKCSAGQGGSTDWQETIKGMMGTCCGPEAGDTQTNKGK